MCADNHYDRPYRGASNKYICSFIPLVIVLALTGCEVGDKAAPTSPAVSTATSPEKPVASVDPDPNPPASVVKPEPKVELFPGTGSFVGRQASGNRGGASVGTQGDITLNFIGMDVQDVAKVILGDYLKLNYEIAANVQGSITLQTSKPLQRSQVLPVLEQVLRLNDMALVHTNGIYKVVPLTNAHSTSGPINGPGSHVRGYGIEVVPVHYISASEMQKLLEPLAPVQGTIHVDAARNILIIEGTEDERQTLRENVALFDSDWLSGMSYALYTPNYTDAGELTKELEQILGGTSSPIAGVVKLVPIDRLNAILAISPQARYLEQLKAWVSRLDRPGQGSDKRVYIYYVQNGRATDLAATISKVLFGTSGSQSASGSNSRSAFIADSTPSQQSVMGKSGMPQSNQVALPTGSMTSMSGATITADETNNALAILATPAEYSVIESALHQLDSAPMQVYLEAVIAEVTLTNDFQFGVQYFYNPGSGSSMTLSNSSTSAIAQSFPGFSYLFTRGSNIKLILNSLSTRTHVEVISSPQIMVLNNQTATLQVGDKVPIATEQTVSTVTSSSSIVNSIQYQDTGVILKVTPRVNRSGMVMMDISQEVSEVTTTTSSEIDSPTIQQRKISTTVSVPEGETFALGGLIKNNKTQSKSGLPYLQRIPYLGSIFGDNEDNSTRTEMMVLITPHVINSTDKARAVTAELRRKLAEVQPLLDQVH